MFVESVVSFVIFVYDVGRSIVIFILVDEIFTESLRILVHEIILESE